MQFLNDPGTMLPALSLVVGLGGLVHKSAQLIVSVYMQHENCSEQKNPSIGVIPVVLLKETMQVNTLNLYFDGKAAEFTNESEDLTDISLRGQFLNVPRRARAQGVGLFCLRISIRRSLLSGDSRRHARMDDFGCSGGFPRLGVLFLFYFTPSGVSLPWFRGSVLILSPQGWACYLTHNIRRNSERQKVLRR